MLEVGPSEGPTSATQLGFIDEGEKGVKLFEFVGQSGDDLLNFIVLEEFNAL